MQTIRVLLLQQTSYQQMISFFLKEMDHFFVAPSNDKEWSLKPNEVVIMQPSPLHDLDIQTMAFDKRRPQVMQLTGQLFETKPENDLSPEDKQKLQEVKRFIE